MVKARKNSRRKPDLLIRLLAERRMRLKSLRYLRMRMSTRPGGLTVLVIHQIGDEEGRSLTAIVCRNQANNGRPYESQHEAHPALIEIVHTA